MGLGVQDRAQMEAKGQAGAHLLAGAGEEKHRVARLLKSHQRGAVGVEAAEDDLAGARLLEHHLCRQPAGVSVCAYGQIPRPGRRLNTSAAREIK